MMSSSFTFFILLLTIRGSLQAKKVSPSSPTYRAAVVEFKPVIYKNDSARTLNENSAVIVQYIKQAAKKKADIVVFPELIPTTVNFPLRQALLPWATQGISQWNKPCSNSDLSVSNAVRQVACEAKRRKIYVAINVIERDVYTGKVCPHDGFSFYISSVVFDRNGMIISRYRKSHLFEERDILDVLNPPENVTFTTDFGVTFGHIIGSDLFFQKPWMDVAENVTDFIFQAAWSVELPFLSPIQIHAGWSYAKDMNLLVAGYNSPKKGFTGSGIYAGRQGILSAVMTLREQEELLIANVTKKSIGAAHPSTLQLDTEGRVKLVSENTFGYQIRNESLRKNESRNVFFIRNDTSTLKGATTKLISKNGSLIDELSHDGIVCKFETNVTNLIAPASYRLIAYGGPYQIDRMDTLGVKICSILSCSNVTLNSCGRILNSSTIFHFLAVTAVYPPNINTTMVPDSLGTNLFPLRNWFFDEYEQGKEAYSLIYLPKSTQNLITFGIWGRDYNKDIISEGTRISTDLLGSSILLIIIGKFVA